MQHEGWRAAFEAPVPTFKAHLGVRPRFSLIHQHCLTVTNIRVDSLVSDILDIEAGVISAHRSFSFVATISLVEMTRKVCVYQRCIQIAA